VQQLEEMEEEENAAKANREGGSGSEDDSPANLPAGTQHFTLHPKSETAFQRI
jgi:hypothetical protein